MLIECFENFLRLDRNQDTSWSHTGRNNKPFGDEYDEGVAFECSERQWHCKNKTHTIHGCENYISNIIPFLACLTEAMFRQNFKQFNWTKANRSFFFRFNSNYCDEISISMRAVCIFHNIIFSVVSCRLLKYRSLPNQHCQSWRPHQSPDAREKQQKVAN